MKIQVKRLARLLTPMRFRLVEYSKITKDALFSRLSTNCDLFECILIGGSGNRSEKVWAHAAVRLTYGFGGVAPKELGELELIKDLGDSTCRGSRFLETRTDAQGWEQELAALADSQCLAVNQRYGKDLLARTITLREAVGKYMQLWGTRDANELWRKAEVRTTSNQMGLARQWARRLLLTYDKEELYASISLGIMAYSEEVEGRQIFTDGIDPVINRELYCRIQLSADRFLHPRILAS